MLLYTLRLILVGIFTLACAGTISAQGGGNPFAPQGGDKADGQTTEDLLDLDGSRAAAKKKAAEEAARKKAGLGALISNLCSDDVKERRAGMYTTYAWPEDSLLVILDALIKPETKKKNNLRHTVGLMGRDTIDPVIALLDHPEEEARVEAIALLGRLRSSKAKNYLLGIFGNHKLSKKERDQAELALTMIRATRPRQEIALDELRKAINELYVKEQRFLGEELEKTTFWRWDAKKEKLTKEEYFLWQVNRILAERFAKALYRNTHFLNLPEKGMQASLKKARLLVLLGELELRGVEMVRSQVPPEIPVKLESLAGLPMEKALALVADVLPMARQRELFSAEAAACRFLGQKGNASLLETASGKLAPLVQSTLSPSSSARIEAATAVVKIAVAPDTVNATPGAPFRGANYVTDVLLQMAKSTGRRSAFVLAQNGKNAGLLTSQLETAGYRCDVSFNHKEFFHSLANNPDYELGLLDSTLTSPPPVRMLAALRADYRSAQLPVGLITPSKTLLKFEVTALADKTRLTEAMVPVTSPTLQARQIKDLLQLQPLTATTQKQRDEYAARAIGALLQISQRGQFLYGDQRVSAVAEKTSIFTPKRMSEAIKLLAETPFGSSQKGLVDIASRSIFSEMVQKKATAAFIDHVKKHGLLLSDKEIEEQYSRYDASGGIGGATQVLLGQILDVIELGILATVPPPQKIGYAEKACTSLLNMCKTIQAPLGANQPHTRLSKGELFAPRRAITAIRLFEETPLSDSQRALIEIASENFLPIHRRSMALDSFLRSIKENGLLLQEEDIDAQYERYNNSRHLDKATIKIHTNILDTIEAEEAKE